ncbi:unnamed protein product [Phytomonas sp. Hart1]|nr:unnamed protein product [Phytomonas sp. Hart1]|eukprot:CCW71263.1 unnamed protein product [Phytomonas sp. isolate Hart1]
MLVFLWSTRTTYFIGSPRLVSEGDSSHTNPARLESAVADCDSYFASPIVERLMVWKAVR